MSISGGGGRWGWEGGWVGHVFNTTETVKVMIHLFDSLVNRIANQLIQNRISKTTLSRKPRVRIQLTEGDLCHT